MIKPLIPTMYRFLDNPQDEVIGVILKTKNYNQFQNFTKLNREIDKPHARDLIKKLQKNRSLVLEPILVDKNMKVVDGQHRLYALSRLNLPVNYIIDNDISINDAISLNSNQKNWSLLDYIQLYVNKGNLNYKLLQEEFNKYKSVSTINVIAKAFSSTFTSTGYYGGNDTKKIKQGKYKFNSNSKNEVEKFFNFIASIQQTAGSSKKISGFLQEGIKPWYFNPKVNKKRLTGVIDAKFIAQFPRSSSLCAAAIGRKYNSRLRNKINYSIDNNGRFNFI